MIRGLLVRLGSSAAAPFLPYIIGAAVAAAGAGGWHLYHVVYDKGAAHGTMAERRTWQPVVAALRTERANNVTLRAAITKQNGQIAALSVEGARRTAEAHAATVAGDKAKASAAASLAKLRATAPPASAATDAVEALELGRALWADLH